MSTNCMYLQLLTRVGNSRQVPMIVARAMINRQFDVGVGYLLFFDNHFGVETGFVTVFTAA